MYTLPFAHFLDCQSSENELCTKVLFGTGMHTFRGETTRVCGFNT